MTSVSFATCCRSKALTYLQQVEPSRNFTDTPESVKPLLDLVEKDILRVQDPMMYGSRISVIAGNNFTSQHRAACTEACKILTEVQPS